MENFGTFNNPVWTIQQVVQFYALLGLIAVIIIGFLWLFGLMIL